jgi:hypothetical protein
MRTAPRKLRPFRPSPLSLEAICPVSSLATALPIAATAGAAGTMSSRPPQPTRSESPPLATFQPRVLTSEAVGAMRQRDAGAGPEVAMPSRTALTIRQQAGPVIGNDLGRYDNAITIASVNVPAARQSAAPAQDGGGGGGVASPGTSNAAGSTAQAGGQRLATSAGQPRPVVAASAQGGGDGEIRMMALRP